MKNNEQLYNKQLDIDCVIIGVNCEITLQQCIQSVTDSNYSQGRIDIYYVDGGSTDKSILIAKNFPQVHVIKINPQYPTPGLQRNHGWKAGKSLFVQFMDSDTILDKHWFAKAVLNFSDSVGAIRGNRVELYPDNSIYNWIGNQEWNAIPGKCDAFGGDVLIRRSILEQTNGYDELLVGGEDPELSQRVRINGWEIIQLNELMTKHNLAMTRFSQYWKRAYRTGYGYAAVTVRHLNSTKSFWVHEFIRILIRGGGFLTLMLSGFLGAFWYKEFLLFNILAIFLLLYPRISRVSCFMTEKKLLAKKAKLYAWHCSIVVVPEFFGIMRYFVTVLTGNPLKNRVKRLKTK